MADYEFNQENPEEVLFGAAPGGSNVYFQQKKNFLTIADAVGGPDEGGTKLITDDHTFDAGQGFIKSSVYREGSTATAKSSGEPGFMGKLPYELTYFIVGDTPVIKERCEQMLNKEFIALQEDPDCNNPRLIQYGCECDPAICSNVEFEQGNKLTGGKRGYKITLLAICTFDYEGDLTLKDL